MKTASSANRFNIFFSTHKELNDSIISAELPSFGSSAVFIGNLGKGVKVPGDTLEIDEMTITFKLDENYENYQILVDWILNNIKNANAAQNLVFDTIDYVILGTSYKPLFVYNMQYVFPVSIGAIQHTTTTENAEELTFDCTFSINQIFKK